MGDAEKLPLRLQFNPKVRLEFHGAIMAADAGLLPIRGPDDVLGLTHIARDYFQKSRSGRSFQNHWLSQIRHSVKIAWLVMMTPILPRMAHVQGNQFNLGNSGLKQT